MREDWEHIVWRTGDGRKDGTIKVGIVSNSIAEFLLQHLRI